MLLNRCAHRGVEFCQAAHGNAREFMCPYHQWTYDLAGKLIGVPFRRGVRQQGGMPADFRLEEHGLTRLAVARRHGVVFASFASDMPDLETYLGPAMLTYFDRVFDGRALRVLGYMRQRIGANWKLMFENIKDPYHASLLHVFLVTFGLFRADQPSAVEMDASGMHSVLVSKRGEQKANEGTAEMKSFRADLQAADPRLLDPVREFAGDATVVMQTLWPNLIVQQQSNTLAMRQLVTRGPGAFDLMWTFFGYADESAEMTQRRLRQANLMGPSGFVSVDDSEIMEFSQHGIDSFPRDEGVVEMGGRDVRNEAHMVTEDGDPRLLPGISPRHGALGPRFMVSPEIRDEIDALYADYAETLDENQLERWPDLFVEDCLYKVVPRENWDRDLPLALMRCESRGMLKDRVNAVRNTAVYAPRNFRHFIGQFRIQAEAPDRFRVRANYVVLQTLVDDLTRIQNAGKYVDLVVRTDEGLRFKEKICVFDSVLVPNSLIYPV